MSFFDKKQDVIDIKLTQFGKNLLARGFFKPVYYCFFDDDIIYNSEFAGIKETQKRSTERIEEAQRLKTQYLVIPIEKRFEENQNLINSGSVKTFPEIKRRQDPFLQGRILKYPLQHSRVNEKESPTFRVKAEDSEIKNPKQTTTVEGIALPIPQLNFSASHELLEDRRKQVEVPDEILEREYYMDLMAKKIEFLDKTSIAHNEQDVLIDLEELEVDDLLENFDIEIFKEKDDGKWVRLETEEEVAKYIKIVVDDEIDEEVINENTNMTLAKNAAAAERLPEPRSEPGPTTPTYGDNK